MDLMEVDGILNHSIVSRRVISVLEVYILETMTGQTALGGVISSDGALEIRKPDNPIGVVEFWGAPWRMLGTVIDCESIDMDIVGQSLIFSFGIPSHCRSGYLFIFLVKGSLAKHACTRV